MRKLLSLIAFPIWIATILLAGFTSNRSAGYLGDIEPAKPPIQSTFVAGNDLLIEFAGAHQGRTEGKDRDDRFISRSLVPACHLTTLIAQSTFPSTMMWLPHIQIGSPIPPIDHYDLLRLAVLRLFVAPNAP